MLPSSKRLKAGVTVVELLVTATVVALLAAIVTPAMNRIHASGRSVKCLSNLRQIGLATLSFAADNQMSLPPGTSWDSDISIYLGASGKSYDKGIFVCPVDAALRKVGGAPLRSYTANGLAADSTQRGVFSSSAIPVSLKLTQITKPSQTILFFEWFTDKSGNEIKNLADGNAFSWCWGYTGISSAPILPDKTFYHGETANYVFADGHACRFKVSDICIGDFWRGLR